MSTDNQGATQIDEQPRNTSEESQSQSFDNVTTILLDDLVQIIPFKKAAMKIDVEGHEHKAFDKAHEFLTAINISYIYMEWLFLGKYQEPKSDDFALVQKMLKMFQEKGFEPYRVTIKKQKTNIAKLKPESGKKWPQNVLWAKRKPVLSSH